MKKAPVLDFVKYGYRNLVWFETDPKMIDSMVKIFAPRKLYIADGHHRAASAAAYRKAQLSSGGATAQVQSPWQNMMVYAAADDQIRILPYNRVIKKLPMSTEAFLTQVQQKFTLERQPHAFNPSKRGEIAMCLLGQWYKLTPHPGLGSNIIDNLDVAILQNHLLGPILGIKDPRSDENIYFVGGLLDPILMEKHVTEKKNAIFFNLYPVAMRDIEVIGDQGGVMPPKSTWFDPKLLSGMLLYSLNE